MRPVSVCYPCRDPHRWGTAQSRVDPSIAPCLRGCCHMVCVTCNFHPLTIAICCLSIPSTVNVLQLNALSGPFMMSVLPSSLIHVALTIVPQRLEPCLLSSLRRLRLSCWRGPLEINTLPASLQELMMDRYNTELLPSALPAGLLHLTFSTFDQPLSAGALPPSLISFDIGYAFRHPLLPGNMHYTGALIFSSFQHYLSPPFFSPCPSLSVRCTALVAAAVLAQPLHSRAAGQG